MDFREVLEYYKGKRVFITGHTGFKGTWLCQILRMCGAQVSGYALEPPTNPSLFEYVNMKDHIRSYIGDISDFQNLYRVFNNEKPQIVIHMAAQPLVRESYKNPKSTYETNVMGTVNILECIRNSDFVESVVNVTTDKVYRNNESEKGYVETDYLDGYDPYSNSKSCSELVTHSYIRAFFTDKKIPVSTCRAGNVIGGGDFATDRIIPDCVRACFDEKRINVRNPNSIRPYQHVLEPLFAYLTIAMKQNENYDLASSYNIGPNEDNCVTTGELVDIFVEAWNKYRSKYGVDRLGEAVRCDVINDGPHEANYLKLDCTKFRQTFDWRPKWDIQTTIDRILEFEIKRKLGASADELAECMNKQIKEYVGI